MIQGMIRHARGAFYQVYNADYTNPVSKTYLNDVQALTFWVRRILDEGSTAGYGHRLPWPMETRAGGVLWLNDPEQVVTLVPLTPRDMDSLVDLVVLYTGTKGSRSVRFKRVIFGAGRSGSELATLRPPVDKGQANVQAIPFRVSNPANDLKADYYTADPITNYIVFGTET